MGKHDIQYAIINMAPSRPIII